MDLIKKLQQAAGVQGTMCWGRGCLWNWGTQSQAAWIPEAEAGVSLGITPSLPRAVLVRLTDSSAFELLLPLHPSLPQEVEPSPGRPF